MTPTAGASSSFPKLFTPMKIGPVESRNRIVLGAHFTQFTEPTTPGEPGYYGARYARYLGEFARGGTGIVIGGQAAVHPTTAYQMPNNACAWDEASIPGLALVANAAHEHGALAFLQLAHNGGVNGGAWSKLPAWAPSLVANYMEPPKPIEHHEIASVIDGFAAFGRELCGRGARRRGDPRGTRLPDPRVPLAAQQSPHRRVRRRPRGSHALLRRGAGGRARRGGQQDRRRCAPRRRRGGAGRLRARSRRRGRDRGRFSRPQGSSTSSTSASGRQGWGWSGRSTHPISWGSRRRVPCARRCMARRSSRSTGC